MTLKERLVAVLQDYGGSFSDRCGDDIFTMIADDLVVAVEQHIWENDLPSPPQETR